MLLAANRRSLDSAVFSFFVARNSSMTGLVWLCWVLFLERMWRAIVVGGLIIGKFIRDVLGNLLRGGTLDRVSLFVRLHERGCRSAWVIRSRESWIFQILVIFPLEVYIWTQVYLVNLDILVLLSVRILRRAGSVKFVTFTHTLLALVSLNLCSLSCHSLS